MNVVVGSILKWTGLKDKGSIWEVLKLFEQGSARARCLYCTKDGPPDYKVDDTITIYGVDNPGLYEEIDAFEYWVKTTRKEAGIYD